MERAISERLLAPFVEHPATVEETYAEHFGVAIGFAGTLAVAAAGALVHAVVPALCERTASTRIVRLHERMASGRRSAVVQQLTDRLRAAG